MEEGQEGTDAGQPDPRAGQSSGPLVDSLVAFDDSDVDVGGAHNLLGCNCYVYPCWMSLIHGAAF